MVGVVKSFTLGSSKGFFCLTSQSHSCVILMGLSLSEILLDRLGLTSSDPLRVLQGFVCVRQKMYIKIRPKPLYYSHIGSLKEYSLRLSVFVEKKMYIKVKPKPSYYSDIVELRIYEVLAYGFPLSNPNLGFH